MRAALLAVISVAVAGCSHAPTPASLPNWADLTIRTRTTVESPGAPVYATIHQFKGARERYQISMETGGVPQPASIHIAQCDLERAIELNEDARTFVSSRIPIEAIRASLLSGRGAPPPPPAAHADVTITTDSVDTGERRQFGQYDARHVVMTTTRDREGSPSEQSVDVRDGWYIDVGSQGCIDGSGTTAFVMANIEGVAESTRFVQRGTAPLGLSLEEVQRHSDGYGTFTTRMTLIEFSEKPLDAQLFAVPSGYRRALPLPGGGYDPSRPDTVPNRVAVYWEAVATWFSTIVR